MHVDTGIVKLSSIFKGKTSTIDALIDAIILCINGIVEKNRAIDNADPINAAVPSIDLLKSLCFPNLLPTNAAAESEMARRSKENIALDFGKNIITRTEPAIK